MFNTLNNSISNIFNLTNRSDELLDTMLPPNHKCNEKECTGPRYASSSLVCSVCLMPKFIDCISDRTEIANLLNMLQIKPDIIST